MIVNLRLNLPKVSNKLVLRYNTFEKVSYDKYFIASLLSETRDARKAEKLIDELTGKGSLNSHFKILYEEVKELSKGEVESIIKDSLYPIQKIEEHRYLYIPMLNVSIYKRQVYFGDLKDDKDFPRQLVEEGGTYITHTYETNDAKIKEDNYSANLTDEKIEIKIEDKFYYIDQRDFQEVIVKEDFDLKSYIGTIHDVMDGNNWMQLTKSTLNNILNASDFYYDQEGNHVGIYNDNAKKTTIAYRWGLYWFKENTYRYQDSSSRDICEKAANVLMNSGRINEIKNRTLLDILKNVNRDLEQEIINYVLSKKDVKELALNGLHLVDKGYEKGWNERAIESFYKFHETPKQLLLIYKTNNKLNYTIDDLLKIYKHDMTILNLKHQEQVQAYYQNYNQILKNINEKTGLMMNSALRDNIGKMVLEKEETELRKFLTTKIAHSKKDIRDKKLNELIEYEKVVNKNYELFVIVDKRWKEQQKG
ncbi:hypothetical protein [Acholeplasma laidlawii]|uniref:hypothetical protein n=1 Tax=Acholeplasma laidlawii TaxID=2148 RepID=UPI0021F7B6DB|nr:hypothetical protein [Acholeplasma laidlawii]